MFPRRWPLPSFDLVAGSQLTHVCSLWRQVALAYRTLWTHPRFNLGPEWTTELLCRARDSLLSLTFSQGIVPFLLSESTVDAADIVSWLLPRVSSLTINDGACTPTVLESLTLPSPFISSLTISSDHFSRTLRQSFVICSCSCAIMMLCQCPLGPL